MQGIEMLEGDVWGHRNSKKGQDRLGADREHRQDQGYRLITDASSAQYRSIFLFMRLSTAKLQASICGQFPASCHWAAGVPWA